METGNLANLKDRATGKLILDVKDAGQSVLDPGGYDHRFTAEIRGWHRSNAAIGSGPTRDAAIAMLAENCGCSVSELLNSCSE